MTTITLVRIAFLTALALALACGIGLTVFHSLTPRRRIGFLCFAVFCVCMILLPILGHWTNW